jgi:hypothetical protein
MKGHDNDNAATAKTSAPPRTVQSVLDVVSNVYRFKHIAF